jgi:hypothetical protein
MNIRIDNKGFTFGEFRFIYNLYFLEDGNKYDAPTAGLVFKNILSNWARILSNINSENSPMYLPFNPDDQWTDCLKASAANRLIEFKVVRLAVNGWGVFDFNLEDFITSDHNILTESTEVVGLYDKNEVISALINAEVTDE